MKYFSTFSGIGGFELGIKRAYELLHTKRGEDKKSKKDSEKRNEKGERLLSSKRKETSTKNGRNSQHSTNKSNKKPLCVGYSEVDKYAKQIYRKQFPKHKNYGDITKINTKDLPEFELLIGGFPCQSFSIAGKRGGFSDTRGTLFFDLARLAQQRKPRLLLFENVKGLLSHDKGQTFRTIIRTLDELGYDLQWQVLNSKYHGVPQNRERVFIVGHLRGTPRPEVFPIGGDDKISNRENESGRGQSQAEHSTTVRDGMGDKADSTFIKVKEATSKGYDIATEGDSINYTHPKSKTRRGRVGKDIANTLDTSSNQATLENNKIRKLTPTECERLQGFPDGWTKTGIDENGNEVEISDTQRYKTLGNAVTVNVIEDIVKKLI